MSSVGAFHRPSSLNSMRGTFVAVSLSVAVVLGVVAAVLLGHRHPSTASAPSGSGSATTVPVDAQVTIGAGSPVAVPSPFLGISTEYWTTPSWGQHAVPLSRLFAMLSSDGPIRLRIGGNSADRSTWSPTKELPEWVFELTPSWLRQTSRIVRQTHVKLILDINTVTSTPKDAARWARTAFASLPRGSITAFEVGNEPDIYNQRVWQRMTAGPGAPPLPKRITATSYARSFADYAKALAKAAPGIPLLAPALAEPQRNYGWVATLLQTPHPRLVGITAHHYVYAACAKPSSPKFPTIARVLSEDAQLNMRRAALAVEHISDRAGLPLWLTEINSVTCAGKRGVSNTFATALWAPDALFELIRAGVESASIHVRPTQPNMAFTFTRNGLAPQPLLYGMLLFARTLGPGAQLIPLHLAAASKLHLKAWGVRLDGGAMHVLLLDKGSRAARVRLELPFAGPATVQRLTAPKIDSTGNVTLDGQRLTAAATWAGKARAEMLAPTANGYVINVSRYSAALVTAQLQPGH
jgi:hypothetical protein